MDAGADDTETIRVTPVQRDGLPDEIQPSAFPR
jgi:hypothetical protein